MSSEPSARPDRPRFIGRYQIIKHLGAGGMGAVYKALHVDLGREVALKILPSELASKPDMLERFRNEALQAAKLRHEHIVTLYEFGEVAGTKFLAMEFVDGTNLHEYIDEKKQLEPEEARKILIQATRALVLAHKHGIIHRDIKPSNLLLTQKDGQIFVKLTDFGLARTAADSNDFKLTRTGTTVGTVDYISPEQARNSRAADIRSDIYSLGCTFYHMLAGQPPFPVGDLTERLLKHVEAEPEDVRRFNAKTPEGIVMVLRRMLAKKPEDRYQTPAELLKDLENPPSGPNLSPRQVLEALAAEVSDKPKPVRRPNLETRTRTATPALPFGVPAQPPPIPKLRYRNTKVAARKPKNLNERRSSGAPLVIEGWKPWVAIGAGIIVVSLIVLAIVFGWGKRPSSTRTQPPPSDSTPGQFAQPSNQEAAARPNEPASTPAREEPASSQPTVQDNQGKGQHAPDRPTEPAPKTEPPPKTEPAPVQQPTPQEPEQHVRRFYQPRPQTVAEMKREFQSEQPISTPAAPRSLENNAPSTPEPGGATITPRLPAPGVGKPPLSDSAGAGAKSLATPAKPPAPESAKPTPEGEKRSPSAPGTRADGPVLIVSRSFSGTDSLHFDSLHSACAKASTDRVTIIEIRDNGPIFETPVEVAARNIVIRGGKGYRPLIVWDLQSTAASPSKSFLSMERGNLTLENLEIVVKCPETEQAEVANLVRVEAGNLIAVGCAFSVAGRCRSGLSAVRFESASAQTTRSRCRLSQCYFRGADMVALDLRSQGGDVQLGDCLIVGGSRPLVDITASSANLLSLRVARSTLVAGQTLVRIRAASMTEKQLAVHWLGWDSLFAHHGSQTDGEMLQLEEGVTTSGMKWRSVNCLYSGWQNLLKCAGRDISQTQLSVWRKLWQQEEGDEVDVQTWPAFVPTDPCEMPAANFRTAGTRTGYAATSHPGTLGCDVTTLPPARDGWLLLTYDRPPSPQFDPPAIDQAPEIPPDADGRYHGERINVNRTDLGEYLKKIQTERRLGSRIVLILSGSGVARTSPIHIKGVNLVLYFEPVKDKNSRLVLAPKDAVDCEALIEVEGGGCEITGAAISFGDSRSTSLPARVIKVQGGDLRLTGCRLSGPLRAASIGLIQFKGSGDPSSEQAVWECAITDSILLCRGNCIDNEGVGSRVRLQGCVLIAGADAFRIDPSLSTTKRLNVRYILDHNTIAAQHAVFHVRDLPALSTPIEPITVRADANVFLDPVSGEATRSGLLDYDLEALVRGLIVWHGDGNAYDKHLHHYVAPRSVSGEDKRAETSAAGRRQSHSAWVRLWSPQRERHAFFFDVKGVRGLDRDDPDLSRLAIPQLAQARRRGPPPGADLERLGIDKRPPKDKK
jgi:serine/threonine-protein kinase